MLWEAPKADGKVVVVVVTQLRDIRSLLCAGALDYATDIVQQFRGLDPGLQASVKDLRSQVVREGCITVA